MLAAGLTSAAAAQTALLPAIQKGNITIGLNPVASGLVAPVFGTTAPGDPNDLFVVDQAGKIDVMHNGVMQSTPLLDLSALEAAVPLSPGYDERGLLSMAFAPGFNTPGSPGFHKLYTYQSEKTGTAPADFAPAAGTVTSGINHQNVLTEWTVSASNPLVVDTSTRRDLLREDHPALNHNGGTIAFGPDGMLYMAIGDGGTANDSGNGHLPNGNAQDLSVVMGKMLRIDPNGNNSANHQYGIPANNPFVGTQGALPEIYAYGFRNPYKFGFNGSDLIMADVGQNDVEEVDDHLTAGGNYGWSVKEGTFLFPRPPGGTTSTIHSTVNSPGSPAGMIDPNVEYDHTQGTAVVGGFVYHGSLVPQLVGKYVFGDFSNGPFNAPGNGRLFYADLVTGQVNEFNMANPLGLWLKGFGEDANGEIFVMASTNLGPSGTTGVVFELVPEPATLGLIAVAPLLLLTRRRRALAPVR
jgi:glucose/arabinose dehydrogenase